MNHVLDLVNRIDGLDALDSVKYKLLKKGLDLLIQQGKSVEEAFNFVKVVHKDGSVTGDNKGYTEEHLTSFGTYLLSEAREEAFLKAKEENGSSDEVHRLALRTVHHADVQNWKATGGKVDVIADEEYKKDKAPDKDNNLDASIGKQEGQIPSSPLNVTQEEIAKADNPEHALQQENLFGNGKPEIFDAPHPVNENESEGSSETEKS